MCNFHCAWKAFHTAVFILALTSPCAQCRFAHADDPLMQAAITRLLTYTEPAITNLQKLHAAGSVRASSVSRRIGVIVSGPATRSASSNAASAPCGSPASSSAAAAR